MSDALRTAEVSPSNTPSLAAGSEAALGESPAAPARSVSSTLRRVGARLAYWTPVLASLALFAQVAFLGLRPAISEARRLAAASDMLEARWSHDRGVYDAYELQLRVRQDPIFVERQRRLRCAVPARSALLERSAVPARATSGV